MTTRRRRLFSGSVYNTRCNARELLINSRRPHGVIAFCSFHPVRALFHKAKVGGGKKKVVQYLLYNYIRATGCRISFYLIITYFPRRTVPRSCRVVFHAQQSPYILQRRQDELVSTRNFYQELRRINEKIIPARDVANDILPALLILGILRVLKAVVYYRIVDTSCILYNTPKLKTNKRYKILYSDIFIPKTDCKLLCYYTDYWRNIIKIYLAIITAVRTRALATKLYVFITPLRLYSS